MLEPKPEIKEIIEAIKWYQNNPNVHPLTCGNDSKHRILYPEVLDTPSPKGVILMCLDCNYRQISIPDYIVEFYRKRDSKEAKFMSDWDKAIRKMGN